MPFKFFGWEFDFDRSSSNAATFNTQPNGTALSPVPPENTDGAMSVQFGATGGAYGYYIDLDNATSNDFELINKYRDMQYVAEVDECIDQICSELVIQEGGRMPVSLDLDYVTELDEEMKIRIRAEFDSILKQMNFHKDAYTVMRQWYIDGRIYYYCIVDSERPEDGILELRVIDPRCIKKIREVARKRHQETQADIVEVQKEYYIYNPLGWNAQNPGTSQGGGMGGVNASMLQYNGTKITLDAVAFCPSGLYDTTRKTILSWMHKAIKPMNLLRMIEDSCVIYRISRAPERRVFYIDVGNLPKQKAEEYLNNMMLKYRNKLVYDMQTGEMKDDRKFMSIMEDFWLPRKEGNKGTEISTLPAGQNLSQMEDVDYFRRKLYRALNLPPSRIDNGTGFSLGRSSEISRDELQFNKFINRLRSQFTALFDQILEKQLRLKHLLTEAEWYRIKDGIRYTWQVDNYFDELKGQEMWTARLALVQSVEPYLNKFFSEAWVSREILKFTEDEVASMREEFVIAPSLGGEGGGSGPFGEGDGSGDDEGGGSPFGGGDKKKPFGGGGKPGGGKFGANTDDFDKDADEVLADTDVDEDEDEESDETSDEIDALNDEDDDVIHHPDSDDVDLDDDGKDDTSEDEQDSDEDTEDAEDDDEPVAKKGKNPFAGKKP